MKISSLLLKGLFIALLFCVHTADLQAITPTLSDTYLGDTTKVKRNSLRALPIAFYTPETRWAFGATGIYAFRFKGETDESRPSQITLGGAYTLNKQILLYVPFQFFWDDEQWNAYGEVGYFKYNFFYFGTGNSEAVENNTEGEIFDVEFPRLRLNVLRKVKPNIYVGGRYWFDDFKIVGTDEDGLLADQTFEETGRSVISGAGVSAIYDSRDNVFAPDKGYYIEGTTLFVGDYLGADYNYQKYTLDARKYQKIVKNHVLAVNTYFEFTNGDVPFYQLALLGGTKRMRGYLEGRFRDNHMAIFQAEYRFPIFWRIGGTVFGGYGGVQNNVKDLAAFQDFRYTYGAGIRFNLVPKERINVRFDIGFGKETSGFYLTIGEAF